MFGEDDFDNTAIDLNRVRKLAGLPDAANASLPADTYEPEDSFSIDPLSSAEDDIDAQSIMDDPHVTGIQTPMGTTAMPMGMGGLDDEPSHWQTTLDELEQQLPEIPVGDFRSIIDSLRRLANYAEDIRRSLVTEGRKTLRDYVSENMKIGEDVIQPIKPGQSNPANTSTTNAPMSPASTVPGKSETIGMNRSDAVKSLQTRMNTDPTTAAKKFDAMQRKGLIKANGSGFSMNAMDDNTFNNTVNDPMLDK